MAENDEAHNPTALVPGRRKKGHSTVAFLSGIVLAAGTAGVLVYYLVDKGKEVMYAQDKAALTQSYAQREKSLADQLNGANDRASAAGQCSTDLSTSLSEGATAKSQYDELKKNGLCMKPLLETLQESPGRKDLEERMTQTHLQYGIFATVLNEQPEQTKSADKLLGISKKKMLKTVAELQALLPPSSYPGASASQPYEAPASQPAPASQLAAGPAAQPAPRQGDLRRLVRTPRDAENYRTIHGIIPVKRTGNGYF